MGSDRERAARNGRGRGGSLQTSANPFTRDRKYDGGARVGRSENFALAIDGALNSGLAIILGRTRDGGAISITLLAGEERHRTYCASQDELDEACAAIIRLVAGDAGTARKGTAQAEEPR